MGSAEREVYIVKRMSGRESRRNRGIEQRKRVMVEVEGWNMKKGNVWRECSEGVWLRS